MNRLFFGAVVACALAAPALAAPQPLDPLLTTDNMWALKQDDFMQAAKPYGYRWTSNAKDSARSAPIKARAGDSESSGKIFNELTAFGLPVVESVARFDGDKLSAITVVLYARGDAGDMTEPQFDGFVRGAVDTLSTATNTKFTVRGKDPANAVHAEGLIWNTDKARYLLEYSKTKALVTRNIPFRAEFVRLEMTAPEKKVSLLASAANLERAKFSGLTHVKHDSATGDVWLADVPMVDQGQKGYCVVAATERVMRYYGDKVDENELAQVANTKTAGGTSSEGMVDALKKLSARLKVHVQEIEKFDSKTYEDLLADYNRAAQRHKKAPLGRQTDLDEMYGSMDLDVLREARTKNPSKMHTFQHSVQMHIDQGIPVLWTVMLGKVPETNAPQTIGGHMRLIIGYNNTKNEILYSDSWGAGHELKRMPLEDAWTITNGTMTIAPIN